jgi:hypothetical protein
MRWARTLQGGEDRGFWATLFIAGTKNYLDVSGGGASQLQELNSIISRLYVPVSPCYNGIVLHLYSAGILNGKSEVVPVLSL